MVRFFFRGFDKQTGKFVEGHVEAPDAETGYHILGENGFITEALREDPKPLNVLPTPSANSIGEFADALESALDSSSSQVDFDALTERYRGKRVWVIDRDKIRHRVAQVVDQALAASDELFENGPTARQRVADAISGLFHDNRNIASQHTPESVERMRAEMAAAAAQQAAAVVGGMTQDGLAQQIGRLTGVVEQAEGLIAAMSAALRNIENGGGGSTVPRRQRTAIATPSVFRSDEQSAVLREIFISNLDLRRQMSAAAGRRT